MGRMQGCLLDQQPGRNPIFRIVADRIGIQGSHGCYAKQLDGDMVFRVVIMIGILMWNSR